ncbi:hypothetical protein GCM10010106_24280 [Thermopolyspora flexuosa]|jgi:hypothetical protein|uniref:Uncharacterized protein n=1 Tax=Thermopolyspora flexuosa TaxID=103836 RepID=A0A543IVD8_9ACTN|nr:hypothetical protein [Thermopolyspora flexuosa]TQM74542.1 hypothetical protein FHX40_1220 [Thermopolyspora flexuosa]GGM76991.1 hypothetical protein GCM10010106_24280 [Thermopolyspora flexuosa]
MAALPSEPVGDREDETSGLLAELAELLEAEHGPVPEDLLAEAEAAWPDHG